MLLVRNGPSFIAELECRRHSCSQSGEGHEQSGSLSFLHLSTGHHLIE